MPTDKRKRTRGVPYIDTEANGVWYVYWSVGRRSKRQSLGTESEVQALANFADWIKLGLGTKERVAEPDALLIEDLWDVYDEKHVQPHTVGKATAGYAWANLRPHFGALTIKDFGQGAVDDYAARRADGRIGRKAKSVTIRRELATLIAALNFCTTSAGGKLIAKSDVETIRLPSAGLPRDRWLRMDEMQRLLNAAAEMRQGSKLSRGERFLWLGLETAARKEAIMDLTWDRVDFETNVIHYDVPGRQQTKKRRAAVPISANLRPVLQRAFDERENELVMTNKAAIWATIQFIAVRAGYTTKTVEKGHKPRATGISPHVLRHTAATHMARRGVPLWVIAKILGNTLAMVEKVYAKWVPENPAGTVDMISGGVLEAAE